MRSQVQILSSLPSRSHRLVGPRTPACHAGNTGSNPVGTAIDVSVAERQGNGLQIRFMQVRFLSDTPQASSSVG